MKTNLRFMAFVLLGMMLSVNYVWGQTDSTKTEGFEKASAATSYSGTTISAANSDCGIGWTITYGNVSTTNKITGTKSVLIRHAKNTSNCGYLQSTTGVKGLKKIAFNAYVTAVSMKFQVYYSTDAGSNWSALTSGDVTLSAKETAEPFSYDIPSPNISNSYLIKIAVTAYPSSKQDLNIDDVCFTYTAASTKTAV